jgi:hypothetical protein
MFTESDGAATGAMLASPKTKVEARFADHVVGAVEQFNLGVAGAGRGEVEALDDLLAHVLGDVRLAERAGQAVVMQAHGSVASVIFLHWPDTMRSTARRTLEMPRQQRRVTQGFAGAAGPLAVRYGKAYQRAP